MPHLGLRLLGAAALVGAALAVAQPDDETACEAARTVFAEAYAADRMAGPDARAALQSRLAPLIAAYEGSAPVCGGRLRGHQAFLWVMDGDFQAVADTLAAYLAGLGRETSAKSRVALSQQLGYALGRLGRTVESAEAYFAGAASAREAPAVNGARALIAAASMARQLGDLVSAEAFLDEAFEVVEDSLEAVPALAALRGQAWVSQAFLLDERIRRSAPAERPALVDRLERVTARALAALPAEGQSAGLKSLAASYHALAAASAGRLDAALRRLAPTLPLAREAGGLSPTASYVAFAAEARIRTLAGDFDGAEAALLRALADARDRNAPADRIEALHRLGRVAERRGDRAAARARYEAAIALSEARRDALGLSDWGTSAFASAQIPYRGLARVQIAEGDVAGAFATLERTRARHLLDLRQHLDVKKRLGPQARARADSLSDRLAALRLDALAAPTASARAALAREATDTRRQIAALAPPVDADTLDLPALQRALGDRALLSYMIDDDGGTAFVVRADTLVAVPLTATVDAVRARLREAGGVWRGDAADPAFSLRELHALYRMLVAPVRPHVRGDAVTIVPDVEIATLPFALLPTAPAEAYGSAPYLLREWAIGTELAAALVTDAAAPAAEGPVLAFGRATFEGVTWNNRPLAPLPHVPAELAAVGAYGEALGSATEADFDRLARTARVVHVASHAQAAPGQPLYSRVALAPGGGDDGTLHLYEILDTPLQADLVVLSGCETGSGGASGGEGVVGLEYGVRAAGAASAVATRWAVADAATADIMAGFYGGLADGLPKDRALRRAQLAYLDASEGLAASPFFWAAPVLSGSPAPVPLDGRGPGWWLWAAVGAALAGWLAWRLRRYHTHA